MSSTINRDEPIYSSLGDDPDMSELVEMFVDAIPDRIQTLQDALAANDWDELRRAAHQMKGAAGSYGFDCLTRSAAVVEATIDQGTGELITRNATNALVNLCQRARSGTAGGT